MVSFFAIFSAFLLVGAAQGTGLNQWFKSHPGKKFWGFLGDTDTLYDGRNELGYANFGSIASFKDLWWNNTIWTEWEWTQYGTYHIDSFGVSAQVALFSGGKWGFTGNPIISPDGIPTWLNSYNTTILDTWYTKYIRIVSSYFNGVVGLPADYELGWVVVEKPLASDGSLRPSIWAQRFGEAYIKTAFQIAKSKNQNPYSFYQIAEEGLVGNPVKLEAFIALVSRLNTGSERLVDVINLQVTSADAVGGPGPVQAAITTLATRTGLEIRLMAGNQYATQPNDWYTFAQACLNSVPCAAIYTFGFCDDKVFQPWTLNVTTSLFDSGCQPKPVVAKILALP